MDYCKQCYCKLSITRNAAGQGSSLDANQVLHYGWQPQITIHNSFPHQTANLMLKAGSMTAMRTLASFVSDTLHLLSFSSTIIVVRKQSNN